MDATMSWLLRPPAFYTQLAGDTVPLQHPGRELHFLFRPGDAVRRHRVLLPPNNQSENPVLSCHACQIIPPPIFS